MPRLNIEDAWFDDPRREALTAKIGIVADAVAIRMWRLAQTYFRAGLLVPVEIFETVPHAMEFEAVGLAIREPSGVYIKGQHDHFNWLRKRSEAGANGARVTNEKRAKKSQDAALRQNSANVSNEQQTTPSSSSSSSKDKDRGSHLVKIWNQHRGKLPEVQKLSAGRRKFAALRWQENPNEEYWTNVVQRIARSSFCNGKNDRGWRADFDFLVRPDTHAKALEGKYDDRGAGAPKPLKTWEDIEREVQS